MDNEEQQLDPDVRPRVAAGGRLSARDYVATLLDREQIMAAFDDAMDGIDALLTPTACFAAIPVAEVDQKTTPATVTRMGNYLGLTGLAVRNGFTGAGMPTSLLVNTRGRRTRRSRSGSAGPTNRRRTGTAERRRDIEDMAQLESMAAEIGAKLKERGVTIAIFESSSGGLVSAALLAVPGASRYYQGGGVIYTQAARSELARIGEADMRGIRSSSEPYAQLLARQARSIFGTDWGLAETGAAGPDGNRYGDAPGHSCLAVSGAIDFAETLETGDADREANMWRFAEAALDLMRRALAF